MEHRQPVRMQTFILLILAPLLLLITVTMGFLVYANLYGTIMSGFERKLKAASTTVGEFVDGNDHDYLYKKRNMTGLAFDGATLYGIDSATKYLFKISTEDGTSLRVGLLSKGALPLGDMASDTDNHILYAPRQDAALLLAIDPATGATLHKIPLTLPKGTHLTAVEWAPVTKTLLGTGTDGQLWRVTPQTGNVQLVGKMNITGVVSGLALNSQTNVLYATQGTTGILFQIDPVSGAAHPSNELKLAKVEEAEVSGSLHAQALAIDSKTTTLYGASVGLTKHDETLAADPTVPSDVPSERLMQINPTDGTVTLTAYALAYRNENDPTYVHYANTMRRVRDELGLTYMYTMMPYEGKWIEYVIDPTQGDQHANIGYPDGLTEADTQGAHSVMGVGSVYLSEIQAWDKWGQLKGAYAPIYAHDDPEGPTRALLGMDFNIGALRTKTTGALARVGVVALVALIVGSLVALRIARALTLPMNEVKEVALKVAAGDYGSQTDLTEPLELGQLAESVNALSRTLLDTVRSLNEENKDLETRRRQQELVRALTRVVLGNAVEQMTRARLRQAQTGEGATDPSGCSFSSDGTQLLVWLAEPTGEAKVALRLRSDIARITQKLLDRYRGNWGLQRARLNELFVDKVYCWALLDARTGTLHALTQRPVTAQVKMTDAPDRSVELTKETDLILAPGETLTLTGSVSSYLTCEMTRA